MVKKTSKRPKRAKRFTPFVRVYHKPTESEIQTIMKDFDMKGLPVISDDEKRRIINEEFEGLEQYTNDIYQVSIRRHEPQKPKFSFKVDIGKQGSATSPPLGYIHVSVKTHDRKPMRDWRDMQRIKNQLIGEEFEAVELYPAESRLVDTANQYHLWVLDKSIDDGGYFPFGFHERLVDYSPRKSDAVQRGEFE